MEGRDCSSAPRHPLKDDKWQQRAWISVPYLSDQITQVQHSLPTPDPSTRSHVCIHLLRHCSSAQCKRGNSLRPETAVGLADSKAPCSPTEQEPQSERLPLSSCPPSPLAAFLVVSLLPCRLHCPFHYQWRFPEKIH